MTRLRIGKVVSKDFETQPLQPAYRLYANLSSHEELKVGDVSLKETGGAIIEPHPRSQSNCSTLTVTPLL